MRPSSRPRTPGGVVGGDGVPRGDVEPPAHGRRRRTGPGTRTRPRSPGAGARPPAPATARRPPPSPAAPGSAAATRTERRPMSTARRAPSIRRRRPAPAATSRPSPAGGPSPAAPGRRPGPRPRRRSTPRRAATRRRSAPGPAPSRRRRSPCLVEGEAHLRLGAAHGPRVTGRLPAAPAKLSSDEDDQGVGLDPHREHPGLARPTRPSRRRGRGRSSSTCTAAARRSLIPGWGRWVPWGRRARTGRSWPRVRWTS